MNVCGYDDDGEEGRKIEEGREKGEAEDAAEKKRQSKF